MTPFKPMARWAAPMTLAFAAVSMPASAFEPGNTECIAPAGAGGGWDMTCRMVGKTMQDLKLFPGSMQVTNKARGGGGVVFAEVVNKRNTENNLIVAASSATSTRLAQGAYPGNTMDQVRWVAAVGADYGMIAVAAVTSVLGVVQTWISTTVGQRVMHRLRTDVFSHLQRQSLGFFTRTRTGEVQSRITNDIGGMQEVVTSTATSIASMFPRASLARRPASSSPPMYPASSSAVTLASGRIMPASLKASGRTIAASTMVATAVTT